jgi:glutaredoxin 3
LRKRGIDFERIDVSGNREMRAWLRETTGRHTVPQIFIREQSIGGYRELSALDRAGQLTALIEGERAS